MKGHNIAVYIIIPLALFSIMSLSDNVQAQTNSSSANQTTSQQQQQQQNQNTVQTNSSSANQTTSQQQQQQQQQNQNANLTAQALMKTDIVALKNTLMNAKLAIVDGNIEQALKDVMDLETQLILLKPSPPTKFLNNIHKAIAAIATSEIDKSLNTITNIQVSILKAENLIFKAAVANPQVMQQFHTLNYVVPTPQPEKIQQVDTSKNVVPTPQPQEMQQFDTLEGSVNLSIK
ncbi:MAG TPA: hypothetical protein VFZ46_00380 [Nitrososphaeraceae archaeon]